MVMGQVEMKNWSVRWNGEKLGANEDKLGVARGKERRWAEQVM